jgi:hypothetical protein
MTGFMHTYIRIVDGFNRKVGRFTMYGIFVLVGILLWSSFTKTFFTVPSRWTLVVAAVHVADQADHDHWHLPDAASGRVGVLQGHLAHSR